MILPRWLTSTALSSNGLMTVDALNAVTDTKGIFEYVNTKAIMDAK